HRIHHHRGPQYAGSLRRRASDGARMSGSRRVRAFVTVGFLGFLLQVVALDGLVRQAGLPYPLAVALAVELAILHNFAWHERWTWRDRQQPGLAAVAGRLVRFNAATAFTSI